LLKDESVPSFKLVCCWHIVLAYRRVLLPLAACWQASSVLIRFVRYSQLAVTVNNALERLLQNSLTEMYEFFCILITERVQKSEAVPAKNTRKSASTVLNLLVMHIVSVASSFASGMVTSLWSSGPTSSHGPYLSSLYCKRFVLPGIIQGSQLDIVNNHRTFWPLQGSISGLLP